MLRLTASYQSNAGGELTVYAFSQADADTALQTIVTLLGERKIPKDDGVNKCLGSKAYKEVEQHGQKEFPLASVTQSGTAVVISGVKPDCDKLYNRLSDYLNENAIQQDFVPLRPGIADTLSRFCQSDIGVISSNLDDLKVLIIIHAERGGRYGYEVRGVASGIAQAKTSMKSLTDRVKMKDHRITGHNKVKFINDNRTMLYEPARNHRVVIKFPDEVNATGGGGSYMPQNVEVVAEAHVALGKTVKLVHGNIVRCPVDVIVNAGNSDLHDGGGVTGAIFRAGWILFYVV